MSVGALAVLQQVPPGTVRRKLRRVRRRLADPCFMLATQFGERLPQELRAVARSYFGDGLTLRQCAGRYQMTMHQVRQGLVTVRCILRVLRAEALAGRWHAGCEFDADIDAHE